MPRTRSPKPRYRPRPGSDQAYAVWIDLAGKRRRKALPGGFNSPESRAAFEQLKLDLKASATGTIPKKPPLTMAGMLDLYLKHADRYYRTPDGRRTSMVCLLRIVGKALCELYAHRPAAEFGPLMMKAAVQRWVDRGHSRVECNRRLRITRGIFKWAASEELVPVTVHQALTTVAGLQRGRTAAPEVEPVGPVDDAVVDATLPHLNRQFVAMIALQRLTGMRPGEARTIRGIDIDRKEPDGCWRYVPPHHKTAHKGKSRVILIGPKAQDVLKPFLTDDDPLAYLFRPTEAMAERRAKRREDRRTPLYPSHLERNKRKRKTRPRRNPYRCYALPNYALAIRRACDQAFPPAAPLAKLPGESEARWMARLTAEQRAALTAWRKDHRWHPNQLRHNFATLVRRQYGLEAAQVLLGHSQADVTQIYAERDHTLAAAVAAKIG